MAHDRIGNPGVQAVSTEPFAKGVLLERSIADSGAGGFCGWGGDNIIRNCSFINTTDAGKYGAVITIYTYISTLLVENCIIYKSKSAGLDPYDKKTYNKLTIRNTLISGCKKNWTGKLAANLGVNGNIDKNPKLINAANGNYHLQANSPCIDAGYASSPKDPDGSVADMGRYYYEGGVPIKESSELSVVAPHFTINGHNLVSVNRICGQYKVLSLNGKEVLKGEINSKQINLSKINRGVYILNLISGKDRITQKFTIK